MLKNLINGMLLKFHDASGRIIGVADQQNEIIACTDMSVATDLLSEMYDEIAYKKEVYVQDGYTYRAVSTNFKIEYIVFVSGDDEEAAKYSSLIAVSLSEIKNLYDDKYDKSSFVKNVIFDNIPSGDIHGKARELHFEEETMRAVLAIRFAEKSEIPLVDIILSIFPDKNRDYIVSISERDVVLVKELYSTATTVEEDVENIAKTIIDTVNAEFFISVTVGVGSVIKDFSELSRSFKEAQLSIEVGKVFENEKNIITFDKLGIGRLIYQLPTTLCNMFLEEVFRKGSFEALDRESVQTIHSFFENNLNVSETSRQMFVHRNTLVYRLEKIKKITGLDLREFEDAIVFRVALMVKKYLSARPPKY